MDLVFLNSNFKQTIFPFHDRHDSFSKVTRSADELDIVEKYRVNHFQLVYGYVSPIQE